MKLKFKQSVYIVSENRIINAGEEIEINNVEQAKNLIEVGFAEEVVIKETPIKKTIVKTSEEVVEKPKRKKVEKASDK